MKTINQYIQLFNQTIFEQELLSHLAIEYYFNCCLNEDIILEKYGTFDNCIKLAKFIDNKIVKTIKSDKNIIIYKKSDFTNNGFDNLFFNSLIINLYKDSNNYMEYDLTNTTYNDTIDKLVINIYYNNYKKEENLDLIVHELTHAYIDNELRKNNNDLYSKLSKSKTYKRIIKLSNVTEQILYMFHTLEVNSFIAQIKAELEKHKSKIKTPQNALNVLKKSVVYQGYVNIENIILNNDFTDELSKEYNRINDTDYSTNKVIKILKNNSKKINNKLYRLLPKMCIEYFDNDEIKVNERVYRPELLLNNFNKWMNKNNIIKQL